MRCGALRRQEGMRSLEHPQALLSQVPSWPLLDTPFPLVLIDKLCLFGASNLLMQLNQELYTHFLRWQDVVKIYVLFGSVKLDYGVGFNKVEYTLSFNRKGVVIVLIPCYLKARVFLFTRMAQCTYTQSGDGRIIVDAFLERVRERRGSQLIKTNLREWGIGNVFLQTSKLVGPMSTSPSLYLQSYDTRFTLSTPHSWPFQSFPRMASKRAPPILSQTLALAPAHVR